MRSRYGVTWFGAVVALHLAGCGGPELGRIGRPVALPNGAPQNACEREEWYELAPARLRATGATAGIAYNTHYSQVFEGAAVFPRGADDPEDLDDLWDGMNEPELQRRHEERIEPVDAASRRTLYWLFGGILVGGAGIGTAAAVQDESGTAAAVAGITGGVALLVGLFGGLASQPSGPDQLQADARRKLFMRGEDDPLAMQRGVDRLNGSTRRRCGGEPTPFPAVPRSRAPRQAPPPDPEPPGEAEPEPPEPPEPSEPQEELPPVPEAEPQ